MQYWPKMLCLFLFDSVQNFRTWETNHSFIESDNIMFIITNGNAFWSRGQNLIECLKWTSGSQRSLRFLERYLEGAFRLGSHAHSMKSNLLRVRERCVVFRHLTVSSDFLILYLVRFLWWHLNRNQTIFLISCNREKSSRFSVDCNKIVVLYNLQI